MVSEIPDSTLESSNSATELNDDLIERIEWASTSVLGKTSPVSFTERKAPWWNELCRNAVLEQRKARKVLEKRPSMSNLKAYQEKTNIAANIIKKQKCKSWESYISMLTLETPMKEICGKIKSINSLYISYVFPLTENGVTITDFKNESRYFCKSF